MKLEAGKEMDKRCVWDWLNEVYRHPAVAFNTYSDAQQIEFAHDALVLLKKQEAKTPIEYEHNDTINEVNHGKTTVCTSNDYKD